MLVLETTFHKSSWVPLPRPPTSPSCACLHSSRPPMAMATRELEGAQVYGAISPPGTAQLEVSCTGQRSTSILGKPRACEVFSYMWPSDLN